MKIGFVLDDTLDTPDGVQQYLLSVGSWLTAQGYDVHYLVGATTRTDIPNVHSLSRNLKVRFNGNRMSVPLPASPRRLRAFLAAEQFDVLHVQVPYSPFMAGCLLAVVSARTAVIGTFHILPYTTLVTVANKFLALLNARSARRFDQMLAVSAPAAEFAKSIYRYKPSVLPNPLDLARFRGVTSASKALNIVFLGRLVERKGALQLLQAVAHLREHQLYMGDFSVTIGGKGELLGTLQQFVREHGLDGVVSFAGFVAEDGKAQFLSKADIAVYPSVGGESFGIVLLEGMAAARGVVLAGNNPGYASVMQHSDQLFDPNDTPAFAEKLAHYLRSPKERTVAAKQQQQYVERFDINVVGAALVKIYHKSFETRARS